MLTKALAPAQQPARTLARSIPHAQGQPFGGTLARALNATATALAVIVIALAVMVLASYFGLSQV